MSDHVENRLDEMSEQEIAARFDALSDDQVMEVLSALDIEGNMDDDPLLSRALERVGKTPDAQRALDSMREFDSRIADAISRIVPPADLRERILHGVEGAAVSEIDGSQRGGQVPAPDSRQDGTPWLAMAAAGVLLVGGVFFLSNSFAPQGGEGLVDSTDRPGDGVYGQSSDLQGATAQFASWQVNALSAVDSLLEGELNSLPLPDPQNAWSWIDSEVPPVNGEGESQTPGQSIGEQIPSCESVACLRVEVPSVGKYALFCFKFKGTLSHLAVFDGVREVPAANEMGASMQANDRWQTFTWTEEGRTMMLFFFPSDVEDPENWVETLTNLQIAE